jgi:hypothetical protein
MILALIIFGSTLTGAGIAEMWHRRYLRETRRKLRIAEYFERNLWQFISLDEWLQGPE